MGKRPTLLVAGKLAGAAGRAHPGAVPIDYIIGRLKRQMPEFGGRPPAALADRVFILRSETGSGKSTVLPARVFRLLRSEKADAALALAGPGVLCTQPRILTAQTLARELAADAENYPDLVLGVTVGYQTGPVNEKPASGLVYATAGTLLVQLRALTDADLMARYRFIVIDEAHERSLDTDALLMRLKTFLRRNLGNPRLPFVLLASATLPVRKYAAFFGVGSANVFEVEGRAFGVREFFPRVGTNDYPRAAARLAVELHEGHPGDPPSEADILIFVPGGGDFREVVRHLVEANLKYRVRGAAAPPFAPLAISRKVILARGRDYRLLTAAPSRLPDFPSLDGTELFRPSRRIIVATVVAETGLTIETLKYVIDCGWSRVLEVYRPGRFRGVITRPASQSQIVQRKGRAGRKFPGEFHPLYTRNVHAALAAEQLPEIIAKGVAPIFLDVVAATLGARAERGAPLRFRVEEVDMLDPPPVDALAEALEEAVVFGYLRADGGEGHALTRLGAVASRFTHLGMHHVQTLLAGYLWQVSLRDLAFVVALYGESDVLLYAQAPFGHRKREDDAAARLRALRAGLPPYLLQTSAPSEPADASARRARLLISDEFLEALLAFEGFARALDRSQGDLSRVLDWCEANGVDFDGATVVAEMREQVLDEMLVAGLNPFWGDEHRLAAASAEAFFDTVVRLKQCIYAGLRFGLLTYDGRDYRARTGARVEVPPAFSDAALAELWGAGMADEQQGSSAALARPRRLVTNAVRLRGAKGDRREKFPPLLYRLQPGLTSTLDGYVEVDAAALGPRPWAAPPASRRAPREPSAADAPSTPGSADGQEAPSEPDVPSAPDALDVPSAPDALDVPSEPSAPDALDEPSAPDALDEPSAPSAPDSQEALSDPNPLEKIRAYARISGAAPGEPQLPLMGLPPARRQALFGHLHIR